MALASLMRMVVLNLWHPPILDLAAAKSICSGVIEGNLSDLKIGLAQQSTYFQTEALHEPTRLLVVVIASQDKIDRAIEQSPTFKMLLENRWIHLKCIHPVEPSANSF